MLGARPSSLSSFSLGFPLFSALEVPRGDHTLQDSQQSVVHHGHQPENWKQDRYPTARCAGPGTQRGTSISTICSCRNSRVLSFLVRTRPVERSFPSWSSMCLCSTSSSAGTGSVRKFPGTVEAMSISESTTASAGHVCFLRRATLQRGVCAVNLCWVRHGSRCFFLCSSSASFSSVADCVSPSTFYMTSSIFTLTKKIVFFSGVGAWRVPSASSVHGYRFLEEDLVTHFAVRSKFSGGRGLREPEHSRQR